MKFSRTWAMPNGDTFSVPPINDFVQSYLTNSKISIDPFVRDAIVPVATEDAIVLSFGWNTVGMGKRHGYEQIEIMLCCHGGAHNDTICLAERRLPELQASLI